MGEVCCSYNQLHIIPGEPVCEANRFTRQTGKLGSSFYRGVILGLMGGGGSGRFPASFLWGFFTEGYPAEEGSLPRGLLGGWSGPGGRGSGPGGGVESWCEEMPRLARTTSRSDNNVLQFQ